MILRDYQCKSCGNVQEDFDGTDLDPCHECGGRQMGAVMSYRPSSGLDVKIWGVLTKGSVLRKKWLGKLPWRKSSESQTD